MASAQQRSSMTQSCGIIIFGVCFCVFLIWLWKYPEEQAVSPMLPAPEVVKWLEDKGLSSLRPHMEFQGVKTLQDLVSIDISDFSSLVDGETLKEAVSSLDLQLWFKKWDLAESEPLLTKAGYRSRSSLHDMSMEEVVKISEQLPSEKQSIFMNAMGDLLRDKPSKTLSDSSDSLVQPEQTGRGWLFYGVCVFVALCVGVLVILLIGYLLLYAVATAIIMVLAAVAGAIVEGIFATISAILSGGRNPPRRPPPPPPFRIPQPSFRLMDFFKALVNTFTTLIQRRTQGNTGTSRQRGSGQSTTPAFSLGLYERFRGTYLDVKRCILEWNHEDCPQVGGSSVLTITLMSRNGSPYVCKASDSFSCKIRSVDGGTTIPHVVEPNSLTDKSTIKVSFTAKISGRYQITLNFNYNLITGGEVDRNYVPGPIDSNKTVFLDKTAVLVVTRGVYSAMKVIPKDSFGNKADIDEESVQIEIRKDSKSGDKIIHELVVFKNDNGCYELLIKLDEEGHYVAWVMYQGHRMGPPSFTILSLSEENKEIVEKNVKKKNWNVWYEATIVNRSKKVYCYISPRQLQVKEYFMKLIPTRTYTCKVSPSTQIIFHHDHGLFTLDDGFQEPLKLHSLHREIIGATYHKLLLKNIGGSEKFQDKQAFFHSKLKELHRKNSRSDKKVIVSRIDLLESARQATKGFSSSDWCKKFFIQFRGEEGLDWGGLTREFFELICVNLFDTSNRLFMRFNDENHQALVHPNYSSKRPSSLKLKHFHFAGKIVGKCLYESAVGNTLLVKARFTRSFLAQLIGLRINYKYFESDDPDLYITKIQYVLENDVTDLGLVFAEEEFDSHGGLPRVIPLVENGEDLEVTEENKLQYLNALAQYRLNRRISEEIDQFMKGLNEIIPDHLLSMFDENELELLMCGMDRVSFEDMKEHANVNGTSPSFHRILSWFWTVASSFTQEEMAKLLQFVTGCSQLPPGGFKELNPRFTITSAPTRGRLPTAHTCFNQLCLPEYDSCEQFQTSLMIALNEGVEGFGML